MVTTESLVDSVTSKWLLLKFPIQASPSLGLLSGSLTIVPNCILNSALQCGSCAVQGPTFAAP